MSCSSSKICAVPFCESTKGKTKNVFFHEFPSDEAVKTLWVKNISRQASKNKTELWTPGER